MILLRFLILALNAGIITFLIYEMIRVAREPMDKSKKALVLIGGVLLLLAPLAMFIRFIPVSSQYLVIYPLAISLFIYLIKRL
jgi:hypothetical protein